MQPTNKGASLIQSGNHQFSISFQWNILRLAVNNIKLAIYYCHPGASQTWESLISRREKHKIIRFYKMINSLAPEYLSSIVPPTVGNISRYNLRDETNL